VHTDGTLTTGQFWQAWTPETPVGVVVLVHGVHEHSGRYARVAERLVTAGYALYAVDHPGHGRSSGVRGNIGSMAATVAGVDELAGLAAGRHPGLPLFVYGHSLGGLIALQYLTGTPHPSVRGGVMSAPALEAGAATRAQRRMAPLLSRWAPNLGVVALDLGGISRDPEVVEAYRRDPLNHLGKIRARTGTEMMTAIQAMPERLGSLTLPLFVIGGSADRIVSPTVGELVRSSVGSADLTVKVYDGLYHEPHNEPEQAEVLGHIVAWLDAHR
jgi:acylglycerol lipase